MSSMLTAELATAIARARQAELTRTIRAHHVVARRNTRRRQVAARIRLVRLASA